jgi:hypothetical protein
MMRSIILILCALGWSPLGGCMSVSASFAGCDSAQVWTALIGAAESPDYDDLPEWKRWEARENEVWTAPGQDRIEIYRRLHRDVIQSAARQHDEERRYIITITYNASGTPSATFTIREGAIPAWAQEEGERYFANVRELLGEVAAPESDAAPLGEPSTSPPDPADQSPPPADLGASGRSTTEAQGTQRSETADEHR